MTDKYRISIIGEQTLDGETDKIEVLTGGDFIMKNDHCYIRYKEYDDENPSVVSENLIRAEENLVTIKRKGPMSSQLMLEKNRRHQCVYSTGMGDLTIGVFTKTIKNLLNEHGGTLEVKYTLDFNADLVSENRFFIRVEEK